MNSSNELKKIGRYEIISLLGRGGMGTVYEARDPIINRVVALKTVIKSAELSEELYSQYVQRFLREAQAAGQLAHPHIAAIYDAGTDQETGITFIAMEYVDGSTLDTLIENGKFFSVEEVVTTGVQVLEALHFAHEKGVVHRDIKPGNIMLDSDGQVKVVDFGIAHVMESTLTRTGQVVGTPSYMSPEQITGSAIDRRSDIFSFGVVLYHIATGTKPFTGDTFTTVSYHILNSDPPPMSISNPRVGGELESVVMKALAKNPDNRFNDCNEFLQALQNAGTGSQEKTVEQTAVQFKKTTIMEPSAVSIDKTVADMKPQSRGLPFVSKKPVLIAVVIAVLCLLVVVVLITRDKSVQSPEVRRDPGPVLSEKLPLQKQPEALAPGNEPVRPVLTDEQREQIDRLLADGETYFRNKNYPESIARMETILDLDPTNMEARQKILRAKKQLEALVRGSTEQVESVSLGPIERPAGPFDSFLLFRFDHHISEGAYTVYVDNWPLYTGALRARKQKKLLPGVTVSHEKIRRNMKVPSGKHKIRVEIVAISPVIYNWRYITVNFESGVSRTVIPTVERITKRMHLKLE